MSEVDVKRVLHALDDVLNVFRQNEGKLSAVQVRARSMVSVTRSELAQAFSDACHDRKKGTELFIDGTAFRPPSDADARSA